MQQMSVDISLKKFILYFPTLNRPQQYIGKALENRKDGGRQRSTEAGPHKVDLLSSQSVPNIMH